MDEFEPWRRLGRAILMECIRDIRSPNRQLTKANYERIDGKIRVLYVMPASEFLLSEAGLMLIEFVLGYDYDFARERLQKFLENPEGMFNARGRIGIKQK